ncbi:PepSY-associated TM helix domain-containing protein [Ralstonia syzygii]|uniref:PepSY-associated TM helix domain-containing protein n=1 Tax=Ralstonia syzygii TaxID=28097 RepID=UPI0039082795
MQSATLRLYQTLHTWVGLMAGWALFIAFFAGAITVFHDELHAWQDPQRSRSAAAAPVDGAAIDRFVSALVRAHPTAAADVYVNLPTEHEPGLTAYWQAQGTWRTTTDTRLAAGRTAPEDIALEPTRGELANFINDLHYALGFPDVGIYFMGAVSVLYGLALVSGVLLHLPRPKKDLLAVRHGRNLKRFWMDVHNVLGLFSLPFHLIFAMTAPLLCLGMVLAMVFNTLAFDGRLLEACRVSRPPPARWSWQDGPPRCCPRHRCWPPRATPPAPASRPGRSTSCTSAMPMPWRNCAAAARARSATMARWRSAPPPARRTAAACSATRQPMRATPTTPSTAWSTACTSPPTATWRCGSPTS